MCDECLVVWKTVDDIATKEPLSFTSGEAIYPAINKETIHWASKEQIIIDEKWDSVVNKSE